MAHGDSPYDNPEILEEMNATRGDTRMMAVRCESREECDIGHRCGVGVGCRVNWHNYGAWRVEDESPIHYCSKVKKRVVLRNRGPKKEGSCESIW